MPEQNVTLVGFTESTFSHGGIHHQVFRAGAGPAVVLIHEVPGIHPGVLDLARRLIESGFTVYLPSMFGRPGGKAGEGIVKSIAKVCISREFAVLANRSSPATGWLRALAATAHQECGGPGVGAIGMCMTGSFALAMALEPAVLAPVMSQPALPAGLTARRRAAVGLDDAELARVKDRTSQGLRLLGLRFSNDRACPAERFETMRREFGGSFEGIEIDSSPGNPLGIAQSAHCVLTVDLVDTPGHPTRAALDRTIEFISERLLPGRAGITTPKEGP
ncbi:dienelactone hydrolase family protein [Arthrobacter sp. H16F315]|uniref:dienelactone hydrolase family protein n=1 Tax=Arthrobacter sp. H16F315 TaxID=2955314 RepID=UPI002096DDA6|nr:dienelactone hydrolase family protein [Arthrobacter sp. H16F315]MDD1477670.1 dienelactone hydrolase family protein [Arthrobacter sp. H16F315]